MNHKTRARALSLFSLSILIGVMFSTPISANIGLGFSHHDVNVLMKPDEIKKVSVFRVYNTGDESFTIKIEIIQDPDTGLTVSLPQDEMVILPDTSILLIVEIAASKNGNYSFIVAVSIVAENIPGNPVIPGAENECNIEVSEQKTNDLPIEEPMDIQVPEPQEEDPVSMRADDSEVIPQETINTEEKTKTPIIQYIVGVGILGVIGVGILKKTKYRREAPRKKES